MQTILNNPLASPFTLGMSSAAIFGAALAIILDIGVPGVPANWIVSVNAFVFAFGSAMLLQVLARLRGSGSETLVLFGIALFFTFNALIAIMQFIASEQALQQLVFWTMGSLSARHLGRDHRMLAVVVAAVCRSRCVASWQLTALRLGEERAQQFRRRRQRGCGSFAPAHQPAHGDGGLVRRHDCIRRSGRPAHRAAC